MRSDRVPRCCAGLGDPIDDDYKYAVTSWKVGSGSKYLAGHLDGARGWMPSIWRPNVGRVLPDEDVEVGVTEHASSKGTKRKRAPPTKGPCEHGIKYRSKCKVCNACPHGKWRRLCKECGGSESASTIVYALHARSAVGAQSASTVVYALRARSAVGLKSASTVVGALSAVQGARSRRVWV